MRYWTKEDNVYLRKNAGKQSTQYIAEHLERSENAVENRAAVLDISLGLNIACPFCDKSFRRRRYSGPTVVCEVCRPQYRVLARTVIGHRQAIDGGERSYEGMPFHKSWCGKEGVRTAVFYIYKELGPRPKGCTLHIIEHEKGFVPGNLMWTEPRKQSSERMFIIIAKLKCLVKQQEQRIRELEIEMMK